MSKEILEQLLQRPHDLFRYLALYPTISLCCTFLAYPTHDFSDSGLWGSDPEFYGLSIWNLGVRT